MTTGTPRPRATPAAGPARAMRFDVDAFAAWSHDIGGFTGTPTLELYVRWAQAGLFASHPRLHGSTGREPWRFGERALATFRAYATLRYRLLPYVWSEAVRCVRQSQPLLRPLVLDWQDDPTWSQIELQPVPSVQRLRLRGIGGPCAATLDGRSVPCARVGGDLLVSADQPFHTCVVEKRAGAPP